MIDNKTIREVVIADKLFPGSGGEPTYDTRTASGAIATFNTNVVKPLRSLTAQIVPIQEGTGDPSPSNPRPISGTSVLNVTRAGKNLFDKNNVTFETGNIQSDGTIGTVAEYYYTDTYIRVKAETEYCFSGTLVEGSRRNAVAFYDASKTFLSRYLPSNNQPAKFTTPSNTHYIRFNVSTGYNVNDIQIEQGSTATTYEPYTGSTYTVNLGRTVYGGSADVVGGTGEETYGYIASYNGEEINEPWLSSIDPYVQGTTPSTGAEVVYPLLTPADFTFTGQEINSLLGVNNIWHDGNGDSEVTYLYQTGEGGSKVNKWLPIFYPIRKGDT